MPLNYERVMAYRPADIDVNYGARECIIYALGIGLGLDPLDPGQLKFVYERAGLVAFPTMAVVLGWPGRMTDPAFWRRRAARGRAATSSSRCTGHCRRKRGSSAVRASAK